MYPKPIGERPRGEVEIGFILEDQVRLHRQGQKQRLVFSEQKKSEGMTERERGRGKGRGRECKSW